MGLKDMFRNKKSESETHQSAPRADAYQHRDPGARGAVPGAPEQVPGQEGRAAQSGFTRAETAGQESDVPRLPEEGPLHRLVQHLTSRGADRAHLTLVQSGNVMTHQTRQSTGDTAEEVENGTVDQGSPLFDDVADLYTLAMNTPLGPWRQVELAVAAPDHGRRLVTVDYAFPTGETRAEKYVQGHGSADQEAVRSGGDATASAGTAADDLDHDPSAGVSPAQPAHETGYEPADGDVDAVRVVSGGSSVPAQDGQVVGGTRTEPVILGSSDHSDHSDLESGERGLSETATDTDTDTDSVNQDAPLVEREDERGTPDHEDAREYESDAELRESREADAHPETREAHQDPEILHTPETVEDPDIAESVEEHHQPESERNAPARDSGEIPDHVDETEFGGPMENIAPMPPTGGLAAALAADDNPSAAPQVAKTTDVAPSYTAPEEDLSADSLASGNLVLTSRHIQSRLVNAQHYLFGASGTARDVSTVLVRVRALGTYYDALTHVRMNGFWAQRGTFDLVPEDLLKVQELKDDSYVEGHGAPLAMMFRFRPGVPPEVSFDYSDEEAFVRYEQRLPGQNYMEELRMYPRTGANIPQHVNDALQDWNY